jgi:hypothetical protein
VQQDCFLEIERAMHGNLQDSIVSPSFLQRRTINLYKTKQQSRAATVYPRAAKTAEKFTIQPTREMCINQLQRAFAKGSSIFGAVVGRSV